VVFVAPVTITDSPAETRADEDARGSLVQRLVLLASVWSVLVLLLTGVALTTFFRQSALSRFDAGLADTVDAIYAGVAIEPDGRVVPPALTDARANRVYSGKYWQIGETTPRGGVAAVARSRSLFDFELRVPESAVAELTESQGSTIYYDWRGPNEEPLRVAALMSRLPGRERPLVFMAAENSEPVSADARRFAVLTAGTLGLLALGLLGAVLAQVRIGLRPLFEMGKEIADVRKGKAQRLTRGYPQELAPLATEMNALLDHNQEVVERQRTHVGNLAHALKTPLSVMLAEAETHPGELSEVVGRQAQAMREHVDHHLRRARAAARLSSQGERTTVEPVIDELAVTLERVFLDKNDGAGVEIDWRAPEDLCFQGEKQDLLEIAGNVMENACKWARRRVRVVAAGVEGANPPRLTLTVEDDGPGLPPERRAEVLKRGARLDEQTPGSGLGLSIVDELARAYGGSVRLDQAALGGLKVVLELPRAQD
jgi:signal transduction histidine kinase